MHSTTMHLLSSYPLATSVSSSLFLTGLFGIVKVLSTTFFMFVFARLRGNRFWLQFGSAVCGVSMLVLAYCVRRMPAPGKHKPEAGQLTADVIIPVLMVYIFAFAFSVSLGPLSWDICSEIFTAHIKAKCCAITTCVQRLFQIAIAGITPHPLGWAAYLPYAGRCAASLPRAPRREERRMICFVNQGRDRKWSALRK